MAPAGAALAPPTTQILRSGVPSPHLPYTSHPPANTFSRPLLGGVLAAPTTLSCTSAPPAGSCKQDASRSDPGRPPVLPPAGGTGCRRLGPGVSGCHLTRSVLLRWQLPAAAPPPHTIHALTAPPPTHPYSRPPAATCLFLWVSVVLPVVDGWASSGVVAGRWAVRRRAGAWMLWECGGVPPGPPPGCACHVSPHGSATRASSVLLRHRAALWLGCGCCMMGHQLASRQPLALTPRPVPTCGPGLPSAGRKVLSKRKCCHWYR